LITRIEEILKGVTLRLCSVASLREIKMKAIYLKYFSDIFGSAAAVIWFSHIMTTRNRVEDPVINDPFLDVCFALVVASLILKFIYYKVVKDDKSVRILLWTTFIIASMFFFFYYVLNWIDGNISDGK